MTDLPKDAFFDEMTALIKSEGRSTGAKRPLDQLLHRAQTLLDWAPPALLSENPTTADKIAAVETLFGYIADDDEPYKGRHPVADVRSGTDFIGLRPEEELKAIYLDYKSRRPSDFKSTKYARYGLKCRAMAAAARHGNTLTWASNPDQKTRFIHALVDEYADILSDPERLAKVKDWLQLNSQVAATQEPDASTADSITSNSQLLEIRQGYRFTECISQMVIDEQGIPIFLRKIIQIRALLPSTKYIYTWHTYFSDPHPGTLRAKESSDARIVRAWDEAGRLNLVFELGRTIAPGDPEPYQLSYTVHPITKTPMAPILWMRTSRASEGAVGVEFKNPKSVTSVRSFQCLNEADIEHAASNGAILPFQESGFYWKRFNDVNLPYYGLAWTQARIEAKLHALHRR
jgi:hypothetical protein